jgi:hypothetical protein
MANPAHDRQAAIRYAAMGEAVGRLAELVARWPLESHLAQAPVATVLSQRLDSAAADLREAARELARLAARCRWRALSAEVDR